MAGGSSIAAKAFRAGAKLFGKRRKSQCAEATPGLFPVHLHPPQRQPLRHYVRKLILIFRVFRPPSVRHSITDSILRRTFGEPSSDYEQSVIKEIRLSRPLMVRITQMLVEMQRKAISVVREATSAGTSRNIIKPISPTMSTSNFLAVTDRQRGVGPDFGRTPDASMNPCSSFTGVLSMSFPTMPHVLPRRRPSCKLDCIPQGANNGVSSSEENCVQHVLGLVCECIHQVKLFAVQVCLQDVVLPMKQELQELSMKYDSLWNQFASARASYLKEVTSLRDRLGDRQDPRMYPGISISQSEGGAHRSFLFDAKQCLRSDEAEFLVAVLKEEIKMLFDLDPRLKSKADVSQIERLAEFSATRNEEKLRIELDAKDSEMLALKWQLRQVSQDRQAVREPVLAPKKKCLVEYLEEQLEALRSSNIMLTTDLKESQEKYEECKTNCDRLCKQCKELESKNKSMQDESQRMRQTLEDRIDILHHGLKQSEEKYQYLKNETPSRQIEHLEGEIEKMEKEEKEMGNEKKEMEQAAITVMCKAESLGIKNNYFEPEIKSRNLADLSQSGTFAEGSFHTVSPSDKNDVYLSATENQRKGPDEASAAHISEMEPECQQAPADMRGIQVSSRSKMYGELLKQGIQCSDSDDSGFITEAKLKESLSGSLHGAEVEELISEVKKGDDGKISCAALIHHLENVASSAAKGGAGMGETGATSDHVTATSQRVLSHHSIQALVAARQVVSENQNWEGADAIREDLKQHGIEVFDEQHFWIASDGRSGNSIDFAAYASPHQKLRMDCRQSVSSESSDDSFAEPVMPDQVEESLFDVGSGISETSSVEEVHSQVEHLRMMEDVLFKSVATGDVVEDDISSQALAVKRKLSVAECLYFTKRVQGLSQTLEPPQMIGQESSKTCNCGAMKELQAHKEINEQQKQILMELLAALQKATLAAEQGQSAVFDLRSQVQAVESTLHKSMLSTYNRDPAAQLHAVYEELHDIQKGAFSRTWNDAREQTMQMCDLDGDEEVGKPKQVVDRVNAILEAARRNSFSSRQRSTKRSTKKALCRPVLCKSSMEQQQPNQTALPPLSTSSMEKQQPNQTALPPLSTSSMETQQPNQMALPPLSTSSIETQQPNQTALVPLSTSSMEKQQANQTALPPLSTSSMETQQPNQTALPPLSTQAPGRRHKSESSYFVGFSTPHTMISGKALGNIPMSSGSMSTAPTAKPKPKAGATTFQHSRRITGQSATPGPLEATASRKVPKGTGDGQHLGIKSSFALKGSSMISR